MRRHLLRLGLVTLWSSGCGDPHAPPPSNLRVSVSVIGVDHDSSYTVRPGDGPTSAMGTFLPLLVSPGVHDVVLGGVASNCSVRDPHSIRVIIPIHGSARAAFEVECRAVTGAIEVTVPTAGRDFDANGYTVQVDGVPHTRVFLPGPTVIEGVQPGSHVVTLGDFSANCSLSGSHTRTVTVTAGGLTRDTVRARFEGSSCQALTGDVYLVVTTEPPTSDPNGYTVTADGLFLPAQCGWDDYDCPGDLHFRLPFDGSYVFYQVPPGDHTYGLGDIGRDCSVLDGASRTVSVAAGDSLVVRFDVRCTG